MKRAKVQKLLLLVLSCLLFLCSLTGCGDDASRKDRTDKDDAAPTITTTTTTVGDFVSPTDNEWSLQHLNTNTNEWETVGDDIPLWDDDRLWEPGLVQIEYFRLETKMAYDIHWEASFRSDTSSGQLAEIIHAYCLTGSSVEDLYTTRIDIFSTYYDRGSIKNFISTDCSVVSGYLPAGSNVTYFGIALGWEPNTNDGNYQDVGGFSFGLNFKINSGIPTANSDDNEPYDAFSVDTYCLEDGQKVEKPTIEGYILPGACFQYELFVSNTGVSDQFVRVTISFTDATAWSKAWGNDFYTKLLGDLNFGFDGAELVLDSATIDDQDTMNYVFYVDRIVKPGDTIELFRTFNIPTDATQETFADMEDGFDISVHADAVPTNCVAATQNADAATAKAAFAEAGI